MTDMLLFRLLDKYLNLNFLYFPVPLFTKTKNKQTHKYTNQCKIDQIFASWSDPDAKGNGRVEIEI